jgi:hypothetical protein
MLDCEIIVNVQGDEPLLDPAMIEEAVAPFKADSTLRMGTLCRRIRDPREYSDPNVVKVVLDAEGFALYFSRAPIPFVRDARNQAGGSGWTEESPAPAYKHIGLYVYRRDFLLAFTRLTQTPLERAEALEQLRALGHGIRVKTVETARDSIGVDTDTVHVTNSGGAAVVSDQQTVGIVSGPVAAGTYQATVNVSSGAVALLPLDASGRSPLFTHQLGVNNWVLPHSGNMSTATALGDIWTTANGDTMEIIDAASGGELDSEGALYARRNGGAPFLYLDVASRNECAFPGVIHLATKDVLVLMEQVGYDVDITATDLDADGLPIVGTRRVLLAETNMFFEMSTCLVHSNGNVYGFALRCPAANGSTFVGATMRAYCSTDG